MEVRRGSPSELLNRCASLLVVDAVSTNIVATVATAEAARGEARSAYLWLERDGEPTAVAVVTPGLPVALSRCDDDEAAAFADALHVWGADVVGAAGPDGSARAFVRRWTGRTGTVVAREMRQGVYVCDEVVRPAGVPGSFRLAASTDAALVTGWLRDFAVEAGLDPAPPHLVTTMLAERRVHLWTVPAVRVAGTTVADETVALLAVRTSRAGMARVGPVWTPPDQRRRGYASALTADVTAQVLALGHRAMLFTDLDNPTSNGIYQAVGYRRFGDATMLRF
ncbi:GNAT family N-acetyltransferase [Aquipuribacter sp. MA13-6]|uniref:GNAT family N-acetyltransferase n=1 Tax=unclassified Aquipuribacter TaxID=2635084 RepID=UPI003EE9EC7B